MANDENEWTDEETTSEEIKQKVNRLPLSKLKDVLLSIIPDFSFPTRDGHVYALSLYDVKTMPPKVFDACFKLVEANLKHMYEKSSFGWSSKSKKAEMCESPTRFLVLHGSTEQQVLGFLSWQVDIENDEAVIYCYELQLDPLVQKKGIGTQFMRALECLGSKHGLSKAMLTVFTSNVAARSFYAKRGYSPDSISPTPRRLRSNRTINPDYVILSKSLE